MSATPEQIADLCERLRSHAANAPVISRQSIDMDAAAALLSSQAVEIERLQQEAGEVWDEAYNEGACDTAGWEKETSHAVLQWLNKEGDGFDIHHPDGNTTDAIIQGLYDAKRIGNLAELRAQAERVRVLESALVEIASSKTASELDEDQYEHADFVGGYGLLIERARAALGDA